MLIGIISDTHRDLSCISRLKEIFKNVDLIIHLGDNVRDAEEISNHFDCKVICVKGNCDFTNKIPNERIELVQDKKILITHGNNYGVKYGYGELLEYAQHKKVNIVLFGHTHCSMIQYIQGILFINPGSPSLPRDGCSTVSILDLNFDKTHAVLEYI